MRLTSNKIFRLIQLLDSAGWMIAGLRYMPLGSPVLLRGSPMYEILMFEVQKHTEVLPYHSRSPLPGQAASRSLYDAVEMKAGNALQPIKKKKNHIRMDVVLCWHYLSSRAVTRQVLSTQMSLTSVFGMGTGGPSSQSIPTIRRCLNHLFRKVIHLQN